MKQINEQQLCFNFSELAREDEEPPGSSILVAEPCCSANNAQSQISPLLSVSEPSRNKSSKNTEVNAKSIINFQRYVFRKRYFPNASNTEWNDWHWQLRNRITTVEQLRKMIRLTGDESAALTNQNGALPIAITPYYAGLLDSDDPSQPLRRTMIPVQSEYVQSSQEEPDPLHEDHQSPVPGLVHRYPDRVLFLTTNYCSAYCRYCTRSRIMNSHGDYQFNVGQWEHAIQYIESTPTIRDVLLSGGDPLTLADDWLDWLLSRLHRISHIEMLRIGTKVPMVLPQRITPKLTRILRKYHPLFISIHCTHPDELTPESSLACTRLADAGIPLGSQTVLLKGVNDSVDTMKRLMHGLLKVRVRPYYLYQCDPIVGSSHFRTSVQKGLDIIRGLRGHTSGYAVPTYVIDAPKGGGKIPILPDYIQGYEGTDLVLKNYEDRIFRYPDCFCDR